MLDAEFGTWLVAEMASFLHAAAERTTVRTRRADIRPFVVNAIEVFPEGRWQEHLTSPKTTWKSLPRTQKPAPDPLSEQQSVYSAIRSKMAPTARKRVYDLSAVRRSR